MTPGHTCCLPSREKATDMYASMNCSSPTIGLEERWKVSPVIRVAGLPFPQFIVLENRIKYDYVSGKSIILLRQIAESNPCVDQLLILMNTASSLSLKGTPDFTATACICPSLHSEPHVSLQALKWWPVAGSCTVPDNGVSQKSSVCKRPADKGAGRQQFSLEHRSGSQSVQNVQGVPFKTQPQFLRMNPFAH
jgi:hypothetical protein